jgi:hypothetical protein
MKIHYKPRIELDDFPSKEPDKTISLKDLDEVSIYKLIKSIYVDHYIRVLDHLLPEQIYILRCHASYLDSFYDTEEKFLVEMKQEIEQLTRQEVEPGMFKNEDIL